MAGVEIGRAQFGMTFEIEPAGAHEAERLGDAVRQFVIAAGLRRILHEAEHPLMHGREIGVTAMREGAQQIQRRCRLPIGLDLPARIGDARFRREVVAVDDVAAIARQARRRPVFSVGEERGLANWPAMRPTFTTGEPPAKVSTTAICRKTRKKSRMLFGAMFGEAFGAIAALKQEGLAGADARRAASSGCAPRRQKPAAESSQAASPRRRAPPCPDNPAPAPRACRASYRASNAQAFSSLLRHPAAVAL